MSVSPGGAGGGAGAALAAGPASTLAGAEEEEEDLLPSHIVVKSGALPCLALVRPPDLLALHVALSRMVAGAGGRSHAGAVVPPHLTVGADATRT